jgi:hypothetical protein
VFDANASDPPDDIAGEAIGMALVRIRQWQRKEGRHYKPVLISIE